MIINRAKFDRNQFTYWTLLILISIWTVFSLIVELLLCFVIRRGPTERPYMTELGPRAIQEWCHAKRRELCVFSPDLQPPPIRRFTPGQVTQDLLHLMIGIPSHLFIINKVSYKNFLPPVNHQKSKLLKSPPIV